MDPIALTIGICWTFTGVVCLGLAFPLARGLVSRNVLYGIRFPESFQSDEAWLAINRFGGQRMIVWSIPMMAVGIISLFLPLQTQSSLALVLGFAPLLFVLIPVIESWRFARRYGRKE